MNNIKVIKELKNILEREAEKMGKDISWFRFAKKTNNGHRFLTKKEPQLRKLEEITQKIVKEHSEYTTGEVADIFSQLVNS